MGARENLQRMIDRKQLEVKQLEDSIHSAQFAEMLIEYNTPGLKGGVLFADDLSRCKGQLGRGDEFIEVMSQRFKYPLYDDSLRAEPAKLRHIQEVNSSHDEYALLQVCDVLLGAALNGLLKHAKGPRMLHKNAVTEGMKEILEFPTYDKSYWQPLEKIYKREYHQRMKPEEYLNGVHHKYRLWFWRPEKK